jgi:glycosyltransferase involved in cell wall biosynthesis
VRIAQVAPLTESVPPKMYGGTERVVSWLTEELVRQGHEVTLFASGDSETASELVSVCDRALRLDPNCKDPFARHVLLIAEVTKRGRQFDIIHSHLDYFLFPYLRMTNVRSIHTTHGRLDIPDLKPLYEEFYDMPLVSISNHQRTPVLTANWLSTVYHGLPEDMYTFNENPSDYLLFLGRICPEKRCDRAIEIAERAGRRLVIAAKVDPVDIEYFETQIKPMIDRSPLIDYIGEVNDAQKNELIGNAKAMLFPIDWPEPFGLVMIESFACGTPVIAYKCGSVPEIIEHGITGFQVHNMDEAVQCVDQIETIDRRVCRDVFMKRFTSRRMASDYVDLYQQLMEPSAEARQLLPFSNKVRRPAPLKK